jgi:alcohol dehydrogenase, propanol-preferring
VTELAPLLCAGIVGFRALRCVGVPAGGRIVRYGFSGSAHLAAQVALAWGLRVGVFTRDGGTARCPAGRPATPCAMGPPDGSVGSVRADPAGS